MSFTVRSGEHRALLGPKGAGKSTILGFCGATTHPTTGTVRVLGEQLGRVELQALRRAIGYVNPRHPLRSPLTIREVVLAGITGAIDLPPRWRPTAGEFEELPATTIHALLVAHGRVAAAGPATDVVTTEHVSAAFEHPVEVQQHNGTGRQLAVSAT